MKRDVDLARQLLLDIEARGSECSFGALHSTPNGEAVRQTANGRHTEGAGYEYENELHGYPGESVRYHLRLLIDAGLVKEVDRTTAGVLCVRLTHAGHELLDLCRSDPRWRDAKACCLDTTGGLSLTVLRTILMKWAVESAASGGRYRRRAAYRPLYYHRVEPRRRYESAPYTPPRADARYYDYAADPTFTEEDEFRLVRTRFDRRDELDGAWVRPVYDRPVYDRPVDRYRDRYERDYVVRDAAAYEAGHDEPAVGVSLPVSLI